MPDPVFVRRAGRGRGAAVNEAARALVAAMGADVFTHLKDAAPGTTTEISIRDASGAELVFDRITNEIRVGPTKLVVTVLRDLSALRDAERCRRESEQRYALVAYGANDGLWEWDLLSNRMYLSPRWKAMLGYEESEIGDSPNEWFVRVHVDDLDRVRRHIDAGIADGAPNFEVEYRMLHKDGSYLWMLTRGMTVRAGDGDAIMMAGSQSDITERRDAQEQLVRKAFYDSLTDLPNRSLFMDRLRVSVERARRYPSYTFAVLFIDLDRFKVVNDSLGHLVGDQLLVQIARRLEKGLRGSDTFARLGGDEFAIILDGIETPNDARLVADRIKLELVRPFTIGEHSVHSTASIGIALGSEVYSSPEDLLREADLAMYRAKANGRAGYTIYDPASHTDEVDLLHLENDLRHALERGELELHYQPIVSMAADEILGYEALLRWNHPQRGLVPPGAFIAMAEETGLILPIGDWVLAEACRQMKEWEVKFPYASDLTVSVNLSSRQFAQKGLFESIRRALEKTELNPHRLKLEITESALVADPALAERLLTRLRDLGIELFIDDFGTGYSSLSYLHTFPISGLKIDRSFVARMGDDNGKDREIIRSTISLAHNLDLEVVAEGVETLEQVDQLQRLGCELAQGWYYSRALDAKRAEKALADGLARRVSIENTAVA